MIPELQYAYELSMTERIQMQLHLEEKEGHEMRSMILSMFMVLLISSVFQVALGFEAPFLKAPYLLYTGSNSEMTVIWQLEDTQNCTIEWGIDTNYGLGNVQTSEYGDDHQHLYTISGLTPGMLFFYQVSCGSVLNPGSFRCAPLETETDLKFFVYGDTRTNYMTHDSIAECIISSYTSDPEYQTIIVSTGDLIEYGASEFSWQNEFFNDEQTNLRQRMQELPFVTCLGNHELYEYNYTGIDLSTELFGKYFPYPFVGRRYWSFDYGPAHFTIIDQYPSYYDPYDQGLINAYQLAWIESDLSSTDKQWKLIILHEPGWSAGGAALHPDNNSDVQELLQPLCEQYGVQIVFGGHNHYYARACRNGVYHLTVGGGGAPLYSPYTGYPNVILTEKVNHFCEIQIEQDTLILNVVDISTAIIDTFEMIEGMLPSHLLGSVSVFSGSGDLQDVLIEADGASVNPDESGYYGLNLDPGSYDVSVSLEGYENQLFEDVEISYGTETTIDITIYETSIGDTEISPETFLLYSYPNPFVEQTEIHYELSGACSVQLTVFDISGHRVRELFSDQQSAGDYSVIWNGTDDSGRLLPAGVYFCSFSTGEHSETEKILFIH